MIKVTQTPAQSVQKNVEQIQDEIRASRPEHGWQETGATRGGALRRLFRTLTSPLRALLRRLSPQRAARQETAGSQFAATVAQSGASKTETPEGGQFTTAFVRGESLEGRKTFHANTQNHTHREGAIAANLLAQDTEFTSSPARTQSRTTGIYERLMQANGAHGRLTRTLPSASSSNPDSTAAVGTAQFSRSRWDALASSSFAFAKVAGSSEKQGAVVHAVLDESKARAKDFLSAVAQGNHEQMQQASGKLLASVQNLPTADFVEGIGLSLNGGTETEDLGATLLASAFEEAAQESNLNPDSKVAKEIVKNLNPNKKQATQLFFDLGILPGLHGNAAMRQALFGFALLTAGAEPQTALSTLEKFNKKSPANPDPETKPATTLQKAWEQGLTHGFTLLETPPETSWTPPASLAADDEPFTEVSADDA